ncbi:hypothetical protein, partial [Enterococcus hirae]
ISSILTINIKIELIFFLRKNYCPTLLRILRYSKKIVIYFSINVKKIFLLVSKNQVKYTMLDFHIIKSIG